MTNYEEIRGGTIDKHGEIEITSNSISTTLIMLFAEPLSLCT